MPFVEGPYEAYKDQISFRKLLVRYSHRMVPFYGYVASQYQGGRPFYVPLHHNCCGYKAA
jgi:hypothetical protein